MNARRKSLHVVWRFCAAIIGLSLCAWLMWSAARVGAARLLSNYSATGLLEAADKAVSFSSGDPDAYLARASLFLNSGQAAIAVEEYRRAIKLRPRDYLLWMEMGNACEQAGDAAEAISSFQQAVRLAPHYAHTHWQLGNLLLRAGRYDDAFNSLRRAASSQPALAPQLIDLTWGIYNGDAVAVETIVQPQNSSSRMALAAYFAQHGKANDAIRLFRESRSSTDKERLELLTALLATNNFPEAYEVWSSGSKALKTEHNHLPAKVMDGSFEAEIKFDEPGFGWQIKSQVQAVQVSLDSRQPAAGSRCLLIHWNGNSQPATAVVSQIVLVEPRTRYRLSFDARARDMVTAGPPEVTVVDAGRRGERLAQSTPFSEATSDWQKVSLSFETGETTTAVLINIQRQGCAMPLCPIFGKTWFDNFVLE